MSMPMMQVRRVRVRVGDCVVLVLVRVPGSCR
jgi:hypothetical protein